MQRIRTLVYVTGFMIVGLVLYCPPALSREKNGEVPPDYTRGDAPDKTGVSDSHALGPTGAFGFIYHTDARQILVAPSRDNHENVSISGSPADGKLRVHDVILGVISPTTGQDTGGGMFTMEARHSLAIAIEEAEKKEHGGKLVLNVWRPETRLEPIPHAAKGDETGKEQGLPTHRLKQPVEGKTIAVTLQLDVIGSYSATSPWNCEKSRAIVDKTAALIQQKGLVRYRTTRTGAEIEDLGSIPRQLDALGLLATGEQKYLPMVRDYVRRIAGKSAERDMYDSGDNTWRGAYQNLLMCEYYLATGDKEVLPGLRTQSVILARGVSGVGTWSHGTANWQLNGLYGPPGAYGAMNQASMVCALSLVLAQKCGLEDKFVDEAVKRALDFLRYYVDKGCVPYGDHPPAHYHDNNGRMSIGAVLFDLAGQKKEAEFFTRMTLASYKTRERGHTGHFFAWQWGALGAARGGPEAAQSFIRNTRWFTEMERRFDGSAVYQPQLRKDHHKYIGWSTAGQRLMQYCLPRKALYITGKGGSCVTPITGDELQDIVDAATFDPKGLDEKELFKALGNWSLLVRQAAARELGGRDKNVVNELIAMLDSPNRYARYGACVGLSYAGRQSEEAVDAIIERIENDKDVSFRFFAIRSLGRHATRGDWEHGLGDAVLKATPTLLKLAANPDREQDKTEKLAQEITGVLFPGRYQPGQMPAGIGIDDPEFALVLPALKVLFKNPNGGVRSSATRVLSCLSEDDLEKLWPEIYDMAAKPSLSGVMFAGHGVNASKRLLAEYKFEEAIPLTVEGIRPGWGAFARIPNAVEILVDFGSAVKPYVPQIQPTIEDFIKNRKKKESERCKQAWDRLMANIDKDVKLRSIKPYLEEAEAAEVFESEWQKQVDGVWLGSDYWANPMEDWQLKDGKAECLSTGANRNMVLLTRYVAEPDKGFALSVRIDKATSGRWGHTGFRIGIKDKIDDYRAAALRGQGLDCGVTHDGRLFVGTPERRVATRHGISRNNWTIAFVNSTRGGAQAPASALDGEPETFWQTRSRRANYPHKMEVDMGEPVRTTGLGCLPRQDAEAGRFKDYEVYLSDDRKAWGQPVATGAFANSAEMQRVDWDATEARYLKLVIKTPHQEGTSIAAIAELYVFGEGEPDEPIPAPTAKVPAPWILTMRGNAAGGETVLDLELKRADTGERIAELKNQRVPSDQATGLVGLFQNGCIIATTRFAFSDWTVSGRGVVSEQDRAWGPILWAMHTLSNSRGEEGHVLKMTAQMPPLGEEANKRVELQVLKDAEWVTAGKATIDAEARTAGFRIPNWDADRDVPYRLVYDLNTRNGKEHRHLYPGTVRKDPVDRPVVLAGFTGNTDYVFPNLEIVRNVGIHNPDVLFFSGDQIYEWVGGYGITFSPENRAMVNYLRKWYLLGWAFGDLMRDRVTICLPDDHDVYQSNVWGEGGIKCDSLWDEAKGGYVMPVDMLNAIHRTQCSHHPDPFDPTPIARGISVYYGDMVYGRTSFGILADRMFKSGPQGKVTTWKTRADHVRDETIDVKTLDKPGLELLGERQEAFLEKWATDWRDADMKIVLSQTIFCNLANYHGPSRKFIIADLDSNGWPQSKRNLALSLMRKGFAFHVAGDQHLASLVHHGIDAHRDAGWSFCVPSIAAGYPRAWLPDKEGRPVRNRPAGGLANTGDYFDGLGNRVSVYAVGNPADKNRSDSPAATAHDKASGYGIVRVDQRKQTFGVECYRLQIDAAKPKPGGQFPGWPRTIHLFENYGRDAQGYLPELTFQPGENPVVQVIDEATGDIVYTLRVNRTSYRPKVFKQGAYTVNVIDTERGTVETTTGVELTSRGD